MKARHTRLLLSPIIILLALVQTMMAELPGRSRLTGNTEPGSIFLEDILPKPVRLTVVAESIIYYQIDMQRALGSMAPGTVVQLVAMSEAGNYKVRGRARHGDVSGWMRSKDLKSADPNLADNLKKFFERQTQIDDMIKHKQVAIGMTYAEVKSSLGEPHRKSAKITQTGKEETLEYITFKSVPRLITSRDQFGNLVQNTIFEKVESGKLNIVIKNSAVETIEEVQGNPLGSGGIKIVPGQVILN